MQNSQTLLTLQKNYMWGNVTPYCKIMIIRGIGYRAFYIINDYSPNQEVVQNEFIFYRYLVIRAGHTTDLYIGLPPNIYVKTIKKDRKLVIYGPNKRDVNSFSKLITNYRCPSVYTGRGVRVKKIKVLRKAGKKDKQKGKAF